MVDSVVPRITLEQGSFGRVADPHRNGSRSRKRAETVPHFIGVDGEGVADEKGGQKYVLLGVGDSQCESPEGLPFGRIMSHLYECYRDDPQAVFVGFYLGYDFAHWLKGIPEGRARSLLTSEGIARRQRTLSGGNTVPFPVYHDGWEFDMLGMKRFKLRPACCDQPWRCKHEKARWQYICDAGPFWQTSLLKAVDPRRWPDGPIVTDTEYELLLAGKTSRGTAILDNSMRRYNSLENDVLGRLMERQASGLISMGVRLSKDQWYGPGQASAEWMSQQHVPRRKGRDEGDAARFQELARRSYFGGWFEVFIHGKVRGYSYGYDINSAYPHVMSRLPCVRHGTYSSGQGNPPAREVSRGHTLVYATVYGSDGYIGACLHRTPASRICRPLRTRGYFWLAELEAGKRAGVVDEWQVKEWWNYAPYCECPPPLGNLANLYRYRQQVGKDTAVGKAAKLVYNSAYGKFAQSVGNAPFGNWVYASLITSGCRQIILEAIATHPVGTAAVEMIATDGIFFTTPHPDLPLSEDLGDWQESVKEDLFLFKPGFYWDKESKGKATYRSRGIRAADFAEQIPTIERQFDWMTAQAWKAGHDPIDCRWPSARFDVSFSIMSPLLALRQGKWSRAAQVSTDKQFWQSADPSDKRYPMPFLDYTGGVPILRTLPYEQAPIGGVASRPYDKKYADEQLRSEEEEYLTPEGLVGHEWSLAMEEFRGE